MMNFSETICAVATAPGGAIGVIRISGPEAISIADSVFRNGKGKKLSEQSPYKMVFGNITKPDGSVVDEVLASVFHAPHSYTGEHSVEFSCHGSSYILQTVLELLLANGCRSARPGEFTQRAFLNGKMDLSQAEAVADLIASRSEATHRLAMSQMRGGFSRELSHLREQLLHLTSLMELELDFSDHEELEFADRSELRNIAIHIEEVIGGLLRSFRLGNAIKNGIPVAIVGETNAGKSTLLNALLHEERAIVSDIHGTTRDVIEDTVNIEGVTFRFIDTAGIRETKDTIESLGIERSFQKMEQAQVVLWIIDGRMATQQIQNLSSHILPLCTDKKLIVVLNKQDLMGETLLPSDLLTQIETPQGTEIISISAKEKMGLERLQQMLLEAAHLPTVGEEDVVVTNIRHYEALNQAQESIHRVLNGMEMGLSGDFISQDLRECLFHLAEIVGGEITTDEVLGNIFKNFCIGK